MNWRDTIYRVGRIGPVIEFMKRFSRISVILYPFSLVICLRMNKKVLKFLNNRIDVKYYWNLKCKQIFTTTRTWRWNKEKEKKERAVYEISRKMKFSRVCNARIADKNSLHRFLKYLFLLNSLGPLYKLCRAVLNSENVYWVRLGTAYKTNIYLAVPNQAVPRRAAQQDLGTPRFDCIKPQSTRAELSRAEFRVMGP